ncbi:MAG: hypothetical protein U0I48_02505 [Acutalibacteraceae bacterium]|nr:hypothetical protein [Acutalibacteraceae bacterium]
MNKLTDKEKLAYMLETAAIIQKLAPDEQRDALNIIRGFGMAKGVDVLPPLEPDGNNDKSA